MEEHLHPERIESLPAGGRSRSSADADPARELSTREAAATLGMTARAIRYAIARGDLRAIKRGSSYRIDSTEVARFAARSQRGAPSRPTPHVVSFPLPADVALPLPAPVSEFIGRVAELSGLAALLTDPTVRIVTLTGPGGIGKTRLAIAVANAIKQRFPDGAAFVSLAAVRQAELVAPAIAAALGLREIAGRGRRAQLGDFLRSRRLLLVLDNLEQVLAAAPEIARLVEDAPDLTLLVTSRAPLRIGGEREVPLSSLNLAAAGATLAELVESDAARLFISRAQAYDPAFSVDAQTAPLIAEICARLDGLPLAIELAAARVKVLSPRHLRDRLQRRLPLLTAGGRDAPSRHATMRDAIAWSYDLLTPEEQTLFRRLAVFTGGFTLEAAESLSPSTLDLIASLVDQSLLVRETGLDGETPLPAGRGQGETPPSGGGRLGREPHREGTGPGGEVRFGMLETIREFGLDQLTPEEEEAARAAHARYFLGLAQGLRRMTLTRSTSVPIVQLAADEANLRAAHDWLAEHGPPADFATIVAACYVFWYMVGRLRDAVAWVEWALTYQEEMPTADSAWLLIGRAELLVTQGEAARAEADFAEGVRRVRAVGDPVDLALALIAFGAWSNYVGQYTEGEAQLSEALAVAETIADPPLRAAMTGRALANLGISARGQGDLVLAAARGEEALRRYRGLGVDLAENRILMDLADVAKDQGNHRLATQRYLECIEKTGAHGEVRVIPDALAGIASAATAWGQSRSALLLFGAAQAAHERVGTAMIVPRDIARASQDLASLRGLLGDREADAVLAEGRALTYPEAVTVATSVSPERGTPRTAPGSAGMELTRREQEVLRLMVAGQTDGEIGDALYMSRRTAEWHVRNIRDKLGVATRREAIALARAQGVI